MKKLLYSGLMALMMLFAMPGIVRAQGEGDGGETPTTTPKVTITLSATTWDGTTEADLPKFTVTAPDGITIGNGEGEVAVKVNFFELSSEVEFDQYLEATGETTMANPDGKLTEGQWMLSYALVQGNNHNMDYMDADVDVATSHMQLIVGNASSAVMVQITLIPTSWTEGSEEGIGFMAGIMGGDMEMGTEEDNLAVLIEFTKDGTVKKTLMTATYGELDLKQLGLTAGEWAVSYKFVKGNSTVDDYTEIDNVEAGSESTSTITVIAAPADPEIELICQVMGPVGKNWPVTLSIESENEEVGFGAYDVYYTLDGTTTPSKENYTESGTTIFKVSGTGFDEDKGWNYATVRFTEACTLKAIAYVSYNGKEIASDPIEEEITIFNGIPTPEFPVPAGNVASGTVLKLALPEVEIPGMGGPGVGPLTYDGNKVACNAFYTLDGTDPDVYAATIGAYQDMETTTQPYVDRTGIEITGEVGDQITVKVVYAYVDMEMQMGYPSEVTTAQYTIIAGIPAPEIDPFSGEVSVGDKVYITANDADEIYYSVNAEETLTVANGTKLEDVNYIEITADVAQGGSVKIQALAVKKGADGAEDVVSAVATANLTIKAPVTITFDPANGAEVEVGDEITLTPSREVQEMLYRWYASFQEAEDAEWDDEDAEYYSDGKPTVQAGKPVLKVAYAEIGATETTDNYFYATYTIKAGERPVDPNKLAAPKFMTDSYGESRYAKKTDKVRLVLEDYDSIELYYAVIVEETEDAGGFKKSVDGELTYTKYDSTLISFGAGEALNVTVKAFALKGEKSSDTVEAKYTMIENIDAYLVFKSFTGKNYPLAFTVYSNNYEEILDKDFMVYYTFDAETEPTMEGYFSQEGDTIKYTAQVQHDTYLEAAYCELTQDTLVKAKAYVMLDADAEVLLEVAVESHRVTVSSMEAPTFSLSDTVEYADTIHVTINMPEVAEGERLTVYYTLDGSEPLYGRLANDEELAETVIFEYWEGDIIKIAKNTTVKTIAYKSAGHGPMASVSGSDIVTANYKFKTALRFNPASGSTVEEGTKVAITADNNVEIFYMMFESEAAAKAAEWDQEKAESYNGELQPVLTTEKTAIKAAYAHIGAEAISDTFFYASYTVTALPDITLTFNPASGSEVKDSTEITVTASRTTEIFYMVYADSAASVADTLFDRNAKEVAEDGKPMITKGNTYLKCAVSDKGEMKYFYASYTIKEEQQDDTTAVETKELAGVNVYPNPTDGEFNVVAPANAQVEIFNAAGVLVKRLVVAEGNVQVRLNNSGIYFVRVRANGQMAVKKVVIR